MNYIAIVLTLLLSIGSYGQSISNNFGKNFTERNHSDPLTVFTSDVLLISDIDDTLKITHVKNRNDAIKNATKTKHRFKYMNQLFNFIVSSFDSIQTFYVSHSPTFLKSHIKTFLKNGEYPNGQLFLRKNRNDHDYKLGVITNLIETAKPKLVFLFGDNSQGDIEFYHTVTESFPKIEFYTFIRIAYNYTLGKSPLENQHGFSSPVEVLLELNKTFKSQEITSLINNLSESLSSDAFQPNDRGPESYPAWVDCSFLSWKWPTKSNEIPWLNKAYLKIKNRCGF